jgi:hypothetical protein
MCPMIPRTRDGFALPAALLAMVVIGAIVTGGFYVSAQEHNVSVSTDLGAQAMLVAEYGIQEQLAELKASELLDRLPGLVHPIVLNKAVMNGSREVGRYDIRAMRLGGMGLNTFILESEGTVSRGRNEAVRRVAVMARANQATAPFESAITAMGAFNRAGSARVRGEDNCYGGLNPRAGVTALHADSVTGLKHGQVDAITGSPPVAAVPDLNTDTLSSFGDVTLEQLIASADLRYQGNPASPTNMQPATTTVGGQTYCNPFPTGTTDNWGENRQPTESGYVAACAEHYPIIHSQGNMKLTTGRGQGVLIVSGDLEIDGNFQFDGVVIVTGNFTMAGTGQGDGKINGTLIVHGVSELDPESTGDHSQTGNALVQWDSCAVADAFRSLRIRPFAARPWLSDLPPLPRGS